MKPARPRPLPGTWVRVHPYSRAGRVALGAALVLVLATSVACRKSSSTSADDTSDSERPMAPTVHLPSLDGKSYSFADYDGQVVLVDFWATWCSPCVLQAEILEKLHRSLDTRDVQFLAVNLGEPESLVREYSRKHPYPYPVLMDSDEILGDELQIYALPTVVVIDREGRITYLRFGISDGETLYRALLEAGVEPLSAAAT